jgi:drug/metabolite transporter (DMT)-like permease
MAYLIPPVTIVMSWLILGEVPGLVAVLGGALCFVGVYITRRTPKPRQA